MDDCIVKRNGGLSLPNFKKTKRKINGDIVVYGRSEEDRHVEKGYVMGEDVWSVTDEEPKRVTSATRIKFNHTGCGEKREK